MVAICNIAIRVPSVSNQMYSITSQIEIIFLRTDYSYSEVGERIENRKPLLSLK